MPLVELVRRFRRQPAKVGLFSQAEALLSTRGEASGVALARKILDGYARGSEPEKLCFLKALGEQFGPDCGRVERALVRYQAQPDASTATALHFAAEPRRQELIRRLNLCPGGTHDLVRMREELLRVLPTQPQLGPLNDDFTHLFASWFNRGFLVVRRIDWSTPAHILEKIIRYEAVHAITSWDDLRRRLEPSDRRCFAFFHPALPDEPLIFVEVALTTCIPEAIATVLAEARRPIQADRANTAVFYSISNCQAGLKGVSFGNFLIKQVVEELKRNLPALRTFVTLSPVPGFANWLRRARDAKAAEILSESNQDLLKALDQPGWHTDSKTSKALQPVVLAAAAHYFVSARGENGKVIDPVARFHLGNGARLERIDWLGDVSPKGLKQSAGVMVNYLYDLDELEHNHEAFANRGEVAASRAVHALLPRASRRKPRITSHNTQSG